MRIEVRLPKVEPEIYREVGVCPKCGGKAFRRYGKKGERKVIRDLRYEEVESHRYQCKQCGYRKRGYPVGVSRAQQSDRLKGMSVLLYILGLSYGGTSDFLGAVGVYITGLWQI
jgi:transposase-like protein